MAAIGLLLIVKYGFIFDKTRNFIKDRAFAINNTLGVYIEKLLSCSQCLGFWCGFIVYLLTNLLEHDYTLIVYYSFLYGFIVSLLGNVTDMLITYLDEVTYKIQNESKTDKNNM